MNTIHWQKALSSRVVEICRQQDLDAHQCEDLVSMWVRDIQKCHRPEVAGVVMDAKRILYGLEPIH